MEPLATPCDCTGIRYCASCKIPEVRSKNPNLYEISLPAQPARTFTYCPSCAKLVTDRKLHFDSNHEAAVAEVESAELGLTGLYLYEGFVSEEEAANAVAEIERIPWRPS